MIPCADFLVELGTEELPPKSLKSLSDNFAKALATYLDDAELGYQSLVAYNSPRRLAVVVSQLATRQNTRKIVRRGPAKQAAYDDDGNPTQAALGFARSCNVELDELGWLETKKGSWLQFQGIEKGKTAVEILPDAVNEALTKLPIPKRMRWGDRSDAFIRPVQSLIMLLDEEIIPTSCMGIAAGRNTFGHRVHGAAEIKIDRATDYVDVLRDQGYVLVDSEARKALIADQIKHTAESVQCEAEVDEALLAEVTALVEWPKPILGRFNARFLALPDEVIIAVLQGHQRYFPLRDKSGELAPYFITIANLDSQDPEQVKTGNERVILPRLSDAEFFWKKDLTTSLESLSSGLNKVVFQNQLGSMQDKVLRSANLAEQIALSLDKDSVATRQAVLLAKGDLLSDMVDEFPELQGLMGSYYAREAGISAPVCDAIRDQYKPRFSGDELPPNTIGKIAALADKLDTLTGYFAIGKRPTGDKDPFALRRAALGILRIIIEAPLDIDLEQFVIQALERQPIVLDDEELKETQAALLSFIKERLRVYALDQGFTHDQLDALFSGEYFSRPVDFTLRLNAIREFVSLPQAAILAGANKRIRNILKKQAGNISMNAPDSTLFQTSEEEDLWQTLEDITPSVTAAIDNTDYNAALLSLTALHTPVDRFFEHVMVMTEDKSQRNNRLALLNQLSRQLQSVADISQLQITESG